MKNNNNKKTHIINTGKPPVVRERIPSFIQNLNNTDAIRSIKLTVTNHKKNTVQCNQNRIMQL